MSTLWGDWVFTWLGWGLAGVGGALLVWALFWDRSRGRKRCPKCWYSMEGVGLTCPECGKVVKSERKLRKTRRRWRGAVVAAVVFALAYGAWVTPRVQKRGWPAAVPTVGLIVVCRWMQLVPDTGAVSGPRPQTSGERVWSELIEKRVPRMWSWEKWLAVESCIRGDAARPPESDAWDWTYGWLYNELRFRGAVSDEAKRRLWKRALPQFIETRATWAAGSRIFGRMTNPVTMYDKRTRTIELTADAALPIEPFHLWRGSFPPFGSPVGQNIASAIELGDATSGAQRIRVTMKLYDAEAAGLGRERGGVGLIGEWTIERRIEVVSSIHDVLHPVVSEELNAAIASGLSLLYAPAPSSALYIRLSPGAIPSLEGITKAFRVEFLKGGEVKAQCAGLLSSRVVSGEPFRLFRAGGVFVRVTSGAAELEQAITNGAPWTVRVRGDAELALQEVGCDRYWAGEVELPLSAVKLLAQPVPSN